MNAFQNENNEKSNSKIENIKNLYILKKILSFLKKKKLLEINKYSKKMQQKLKLNINDYKIFCELYSTIEIEITPAKNKYGKFINFNKEDELYYHIYFNNDKEEIKRNYLNEYENINNIKIIIDYQVQSFDKLFLNCQCIEYIYIKRLHRNNINNMSRMFAYCNELEEINFSNIHKINVSNMSKMFFECTSLEKIDLSNLIISNYINMNQIFKGCSSLEEIKLSNFKIFKVFDMTQMFYGCSSLKEINLSIFDTTYVTDMSGMFSYCSSLKNIDLSNFNTFNAEQQENM